jgi:hypothetical protein
LINILRLFQFILILNYHKWLKLLQLIKINQLLKKLSVDKLDFGLELNSQVSEGINFVILRSKVQQNVHQAILKL